MGGFVRGRVECLFNTKNSNYNASNVFTTLYQFFTSHPQYTLIALNYGSTTSGPGTLPGTGTNFIDAINAATVNSWGNNAFFVVRQNASPARPYDVFHLFQWSGASNGTGGAGGGFGSAPGNPGLFLGSSNTGNNNCHLGHACAIGISGSGGPFTGGVITGPGITGYGGSTSGSLQNGFGNPWRGSMNALTGVLGIDTKANGGSNGLVGVWGAPAGSGSYASGSGVFIFPRSNCDAGAFHWGSAAAHFAENCNNIFGGNGNVASDVRMHVIADDDSWVIFIDTTDSNNASQIMSFAGPYIPRNGMPSGSQGTITPYCVIASWNALPWSISNASVYGDLAGTSGQQGGIIGNTTASVRPLVMDESKAFMVDYNYQPSTILSSSSGGQGGLGTGGGVFFDEYQIPVGAYETAPANVCGYLGEIDFIRSTYNVSTPGVRWDFARYFIGSSTQQDRKYSIPWDTQNKTIPRTGFTRTGINFVRPPPA